MEATSVPGVKIQNTVKNCRVRNEIINEGQIKIQTNEETNFVIGDEITLSRAKSITHKTSIEQTQAETTSTGSVESGSKSKLMIGNRLTKCYVQENVTNQSKITFEHGDKTEVHIGDEHDDINAENIILKPEIKQATANTIAATTTATTTTTTTATENQLQVDVSSRTNVREETEWAPIGIHNANPLPGQNVIYEGLGSVTVAGTARKVHSTLNYLGNGKEGMKLTDNKSHSADKNTVRVNNIGPMNAIEQCEEIKNSVNVTIKPYENYFY